MGLKLEVLGMKEFLRAFSERRISGILKDKEKLAMTRATVLLREEVISYIDQEKHGVPNAPLTVLIKGSSRPLVDRGDLRNSIESEVKGEGRAVVGAVGVLRSRRVRGSRTSKRLFNVAAALHEGFVIRVTPKVRAAVFAELAARKGGLPSGRSKGSGSRTWRVKGRPFIREPLEENHDRIVDILGEGVLAWTKKI